jgi:hypothetical protein
MKKTPWKFALIPVIAIAVLAIYPQVSLWMTRGPAWQGSYFVSNYDEVAYSAYVNSLIDGKARKNDPFLALDDSALSPQPESLYSIQFIPAYTIALPARVLGVSASTVFIFLIVLIGIFSALAIFRLLFELSGDGILSGAGAAAVLCLGAAIAFQGELKFWLSGRVLIDFFPFLRRYQPGFAFPLFFVFCLFVWRGLTREERKTRLIYSALGGLVFAVLVFSYFYLWTAAAAWLACLVLVNLIWNKESRAGVLVSAGITGGIGALALVPYFIMLSNRAQNLDSVQLMVNTRLPNFASVSLIVGVLIAVAIVVAVWKGVAKITAPATLFALSFAITPLVLFNQQVITGSSLQPVHYQIFLSNYIVLTALFLTLAAMYPHFAEKGGAQPFRKALVYVTVIAVVWGFVEAGGSTKRSRVFAELRDESMPALGFIREREKTRDPEGKQPGVVLATNFVTSDFIPSVVAARSLWNPHTSSAGGIDVAENKRLFYLYLYYSGFNERDLGEALKMNVFEVTAAIFGSERALPALGEDAKPITQQEIDAEVKKYTEFVKRFDRSVAASPALSYVIVPAEDGPDLTNLDKWYQRGDAQTLGLFKVYSVTHKP